VAFPLRGSNLKKEVHVERKSAVKRILLGIAVGLVLAAVIAPPASAQAIIKVSDTVNFKFGVLLQGWADWQQLNVGAAGAGPGVTGATDGYQQNLFIRRFRLLFGGQIAKDVTFFAETDNPNLGKAVGTTSKSLGSGFILQDAFVEWKIANEFILDGGLILIPLCRNCNESAASSSHSTTAPSRSWRTAPRSRASGATPASRPRVTSSATTSSTGRAPTRASARPARGTRSASRDG